MLFKGFVLAAAILLSGCAAVIVPAVKTQDLQEIKSYPGRETLVNSIVLKYKWQSFTVMGITSFDETNDTVDAACLNLAGIKLMEFSERRGKFVKKFIIPWIGKYGGDAIGAVRDDIKRIYFNRFPGEESKVLKTGQGSLFVEADRHGEMRYFFDKKGQLIQKRYYEKGKIVWAIFYEKYKIWQGKFYPQKIILKNHRWGYKLEADLKEIRR
jgi:hypothetical protein